MFKSWDRMTPAERDLERRRDDAKRTFARLASQADEMGCPNLASRLRSLGYRVGRSLTGNSTPPGFAKVAAARFDRLVKFEKANPNEGFFFKLAPPYRRSRQQIRDAKRAIEAAKKAQAKTERDAAKTERATAAAKRCTKAVAAVPVQAPAIAGQIPLF